MESFVRNHVHQVIGIICGFDRLVFRGFLRSLSYVEGMMRYMSIAGVLLKDFASHALSITKRIKEASLRSAEEAGRPIIYLPSSQTNKENLAHEIAGRDGISSGVICILSCVEPCRSYEIFRNARTKQLELKPRWRKCLFYYHYMIHPEMGLINARIQTWFPFNIQICINGREWLSRQMDSADLRYVRRDNCFPWIEDPVRAQSLMDSQLEVNWPEVLNPIARLINPIHDSLFESFPIEYYWTAYQSEWATDIMFCDASTLDSLYPSLIHHAITTFSCPDVLSFLGRKPKVHHAFRGEVGSDYKNRAEGVRIKHRLNLNSIKAYNKEGSILRLETTINDTKDFKVFRTKEGQQDGEQQWRCLRKGIADLHRRAQVSRASNERYAEALASVEDRTPLGKVANPLCQPKEYKGKRVRALNPLSSQDASLLQAVARGEYAINGFRNRDIQSILFPDHVLDQKTKRSLSAKVTRKIRMLRAHGLVKKIPHTHRYTLTDDGRTAVAALIAVRNADVISLANLAA